MGRCSCLAWELVSYGSHTFGSFIFLLKGNCLGDKVHDWCEEIDLGYFLGSLAVGVLGRGLSTAILGPKMRDRVNGVPQGKWL